MNGFVFFVSLLFILLSSVYAFFFIKVVLKPDRTEKEVSEAARFGALALFHGLILILCAASALINAIGKMS